jgi:hypothetical protein
MAPSGRGCCKIGLGVAVEPGTAPGVSLPYATELTVLARGSRRRG